MLIVFKKAGLSITKTSAPEEARTLTLDDYEGKKLGTIPGTGLEQDLVKRYPNNEFEYYTGIQEMALALESGFIDGFAAREITLVQIDRRASKVMAQGDDTLPRPGFYAPIP